MSRIKVDRITDRAGTGEPLFPNGVKVVGLTSLSNVVAGIATFENVSVGGTLTYEDVTNVDSTGIVTARGGFKAGDPSGIGATIDPNGNAVFVGIVSATNFEGKLSKGNTEVDVIDTGANGTVSDIGFTGGLASPELAANSGEIVYIENRRQITRAADQIEDIKLVIEF